MRAGAENVKKVGLELGGKSPNIVFEDADFEAAIDGALSAYPNAEVQDQGDEAGREVAGLKLLPTCWAISIGRVSTLVPPISEGVT